MNSAYVNKLPVTGLLIYNENALKSFTYVYKLQTYSSKRIEYSQKEMHISNVRENYLRAYREFFFFLTNKIRPQCFLSAYFLSARDAGTRHDSRNCESHAVSMILKVNILHKLLQVRRTFSLSLTCLSH